MLVNGNIDSYDRETSEYIVAYIDLLGIKTEMKRDLNIQKISMNKLYNLYTHSMSLARMIEWKESKDIDFKIFSDNILISKKLSPNNDKRKNEIKSLIYCVAHFQELMVSDSVGWLARGGISIGELFVDDVMVWGEALLKSYYIEDNIAIYPRIILDNSVVDILQNSEDLNDFVRKDSDGMFYLNYLAMCHFCGESLSRGFDIIQKNTLINERIKQKLYWHMKFVNRELDLKDEKQDRNYRLRWIV